MLFVLEQGRGGSEREISCSSSPANRLKPSPGWPNMLRRSFSTLLQQEQALPSAARVVVVGGGIIGSSVAYPWGTWVGMMLLCWSATKSRRGQRGTLLG